MKICPKCSDQHNKPGIYCSRKCANSRQWSDEDKKKKSDSAKKSEKVKNANKNRKFPEWINDKYTNGDYINNTPFELLGEGYKRKVIDIEQKSCCNRCGISDWLGSEIILELEHRDGNRDNNTRDNLELLCPNCHSQTDTWRGRNKAKKRVSDEELIYALKNTCNIRQALYAVGIAPKGGNYKRAKRLLEKTNEERTGARADKGN